MKIRGHRVSGRAGIVVAVVVLGALCGGGVAALGAESADGPPKFVRPADFDRSRATWADPSGRPDLSKIPLLIPVVDAVGDFAGYVSRDMSFDPSQADRHTWPVWKDPEKKTQSGYWVSGAGFVTKADYDAHRYSLTTPTTTVDSTP